jgi:sulfotransferase family protein
MNIIIKMKPGCWAAISFYRQTTNRIRLLPDFIIIGAQRGGTTSLYFYLTKYAGITPALHKEVHFFDDHYTHGPGWYRAQFPTSIQKYIHTRICKQPFVTGESSPYYLFHPHIPKRTFEALPQVKLIVLLRNPIDRAYSHHWLATSEGHETLSFEKAIKCEAGRLIGEQEKMLADEHYESFNHRHYAYLSRGIYVDQLQQWMSFFPKEQFLILKSEDLYSDPVSTVKQTLEFLGVPGSMLNEKKEFKQYREPTPRGYKNKEKPPKMDPEVRKDLIEYFKPHNVRLYEFLGRNFGWDS